MEKIFIMTIVFCSLAAILIDSYSAAERIIWKCVNGSCTAYARENDGKSIVIVKNIEKTIILHSGINYYGNHLGSITVSCGSPCDYTTFVDFENKKISDSAFFLVKAVDSEKKLVVFVDDKSQSLNVKPIFNVQPPTVLVKDLDIGDMSTITAKFINNSIDVDGAIYKLKK